jgi:hypothetical protein
MSYTWNADTRQYLDENGDPVADSQVRSWIDDFAAVLALLFIGRAGRVLETLLTIETDEQAFRDALTEWHDLTRADIAAGHLAATVVAYGGFNVITPDEYAVGERAAAFHASYFDNFVGGLFTGAILLDSAFPNRTSLYALSFFSTYENAVREREKAAGKTEEKNVLGLADHCSGGLISCTGETAKGWVAIGTLSAIGARQCLTRCRCHFEFR